MDMKLKIRARCWALVIVLGLVSLGQTGCVLTVPASLLMMLARNDDSPDAGAVVLTQSAQGESVLPDFVPRSETRDGWHAFEAFGRTCFPEQQSPRKHGMHAVFPPSETSAKSRNEFPPVLYKPR